MLAILPSGRPPRLITRQLTVLHLAQGVFVDRGPKPAGSMWARNPIPRVNDNNQGQADAAACPGPDGTSGLGCVQFEPPCPYDCTGTPNCTHGRLPSSTDGSGQGECSGDWTRGVIVDEIKLPPKLKPGAYVLGWRWDCEETAQVWQNCADVIIS